MKISIVVPCYNEEKRLNKSLKKIKSYLRNKRFKLSYIFCILYNIPLRVYNKIKLSECLTSLDDAGQISLFN